MNSSDKSQTKYYLVHAYHLRTQLLSALNYISSSVDKLHTYSYKYTVR